MRHAWAVHSRLAGSCTIFRVYYTLHILTKYAVLAFAEQSSLTLKRLCNNLFSMVVKEW